MNFAVAQPFPLLAVTPRSALPAAAFFSATAARAPLPFQQLTHSFALPWLDPTPLIPFLFKALRTLCVVIGGYPCSPSLLNLKRPPPLPSSPASMMLNSLLRRHAAELHEV